MPRADGGPGKLDLIHHLAEHLQATRVVETRVAYRWSTLAFLLSLRRRSGALLMSGDMPYPMRGTNKYVGVVVPVELRVCWKIPRYPDRDALTCCHASFPQIDMLGRAFRLGLSPHRITARAVHVYFHDSEFRDRRRVHALRAVLAPLGRRCRPLDLDRLADEVEGDAPELPLASARS